VSKVSLSGFFWLFSSLYLGHRPLAMRLSWRPLRVHASPVLHIRIKITGKNEQSRFKTSKFAQTYKNS